MMNRTQRENKKLLREEAVKRDILLFGGDILHSDIFHKAFSERHHLHSTVSDHSLTVCILSVRICFFLQKKGIAVNEKDLIHAALCHDLGMLGRQKQYRNRTDSWNSHAEKSASIARDLIPDLSTNAESMIKTHMWPVSGPHPRSREAAILNAADKCASAADWIFFLTGKQISADIRQKLSE